MVFRAAGVRGVLLCIRSSLEGLFTRTPRALSKVVGSQAMASMDSCDGLNAFPIGRPWCEQLPRCLMLFQPFTAA